MFNQLRSVNQTRTDWKVRARVTRMWETGRNNGSPISMNLILLDSEDYHVQGFVCSELWNVLQNIIVEGNIYDFENFVCRQAVGDLRPVSSNMSIVLTHSTIVQPVPVEVSQIPRHKFEITELGEIYNLTRSYAVNETPTYAIDIVGVAMDIQPIKEIETRFGTRYFIRFTLYDGRHFVKVTIWDDKIPMMDPLFENDFVIEPILILSSMRSIFFQGSLQISSSNLTFIYINPAYEATRRIRRRLLDQW